MKSESGGIGFLGALFLVFLVLKLTEVISWSWLWVTAPLWVPAAFGVAIVVGVAVAWVVDTLIENRSIKRRHKKRLAEAKRCLREERDRS